MPICSIRYFLSRRQPSLLLLLSVIFFVCIFSVPVSQMSRIFVSVCPHMFVCIFSVPVSQMSRIFVSVCPHMSRNFVSVCPYMSRNLVSVCYFVKIAKIGAYFTPLYFKEARQGEQGHGVALQRVLIIIFMNVQCTTLLKVQLTNNARNHGYLEEKFLYLNLF